MQEIIEITALTMKRLLNYQRVAENQARAANKRQWTAMTLETMRKAEAARQTAAHLGGVVAYAGYLFRVQNQAAAYRTLFADGLLHNGLVELLNTLNINVAMIPVEGGENAGEESASQTPAHHAERASLHLVRTGTHGGHHYDCR